MQIIDFRTRLPVPELGDSLARSGNMARYEALYDMGSDDRREFAELGIAGFLNRLRDLGVVKVVWPGQDSRSTTGAWIPDELIAEYQDQFSSQLVGLAGFDPHAGSSAIQNLEYALDSLGLRGANVAPFMHEIYASDQRYWPLYEICQDRGVPVVLHTSINFATGVTQAYGHPQHLDEVAVAFPNLKIVAGHGGWPWVLEMVSLAWRHSNVYVELSGIRPKYLAKAGTGWEPILAYGEKVIHNRVLFGTNWPSLPHERTIEEFKALPVSANVIERWMFENADEVLQSNLSAGNSGLA